MGLVNHHHDSLESSVAGRLIRGSPATAAGESQLSQIDFLNRLFQALEERCVRYCVLQRWDALLEELQTDHDVDLAVHPKDAEKLPAVWRALRERGYGPIQLLNHEVNAYAFVFAWFEGLSLRTVMVDIAFEHRQSGLIWKSGEELIAGRQRRGIVWVADPGVEFAYLLVKKMLKGSFKASREQRYKLLVERIGRPRAKKIITELFGDRSRDEVLAACENAHLGPILRSLRKSFLLKRFVRNPVNLVRYVLAEGLRLGRRWLQPTGLLLVLLGPDGVGKSTLVAGMTTTLTQLFRRHDVFHWRPGVIVPIEEGDAPSGNPHDGPPRSALVSILFLFGFCLDYWLGYALRIRPLLARSGFVIFDRYYYDLLVDQKRYRYAGPMSLVRLLLRFIPGRKNLVLILDAPEDVVLSRKQQLTPEELQRQRVSYRGLTEVLKNSHIIETHQGVDQTLAESCRIVTGHLAQRLESQYAISAAGRLTQTSGGTL
jgi:thymidylate kinase